MVGLALAGAASAAVAGGPRQAAQTAPSSSAAPPAPVGSCSVQGLATPARGLTVYDAVLGGQPVAVLTGVQLPLTLSEVPSKAEGGRAVVSTGQGRGHFKLRGWVDAQQVPVFANRLLESVVGHVWIGEQQELRLLGGTGSQLRVERQVAGPLKQVVTASAGCESFSLTAGTPKERPIPSKARGWKVQPESLEIYDEPGRDGSVVAVLVKVYEDADVLLWGDAQKAGFVHVMYYADIVVEGWAKQSQLRPLPRGELMDQAQPPRLVPLPPKLSFSSEPRPSEAPRELPLRIQASADAQPVGVVEAGTPLLVLDLVASWASVLPKDLSMMPPPGQQFWVPADALVIPPRKP